MQRLVVVGNGMAGARTVEEILTRGGGEMFEVTMVGDEPYGNYNRIMLSHVLAGESSIDDDDLMLNPMAWYRENDVKLYAGDRAVALDRFAKAVTCESGRVIEYDTLVIATGSNTFFPNMDGLRAPDGHLARGVFGFHQNSTNPKSTTSSPLHPSGAAKTSSSKLSGSTSSTTRNGTFTDALAPIGNHLIGC